MTYILYKYLKLTYVCNIRHEMFQGGIFNYYIEYHNITY